MMTALLMMPGLQKLIHGNQMKVRMRTLILPKMVIVVMLMLLLRLIYCDTFNKRRLVCFYFCCVLLKGGGFTSLCGTVCRAVSALCSSPSVSLLTSCCPASAILAQGQAHTGVHVSRRRWSGRAPKIATHCLRASDCSALLNDPPSPNSRRKALGLLTWFWSDIHLMSIVH